MLMVQQCAGQRGQRPAQAEIALGNKGLINPLLAAAFLDFRFLISRPVARAKLIQMG